MENEGVRINYTSNLSLPYASASGQLIAFAKTAQRELHVAVQERGTEETGSILIPFQGAAVEEMVCCYVYAVSADGKKSSNSVYVGVTNRAIQCIALNELGQEGVDIESFKHIIEFKIYINIPSE